MKVADAEIGIDELRKENENLRSEIAWRKDEFKILKRTIGTGRVYAKLRADLHHAEEHIDVLKARISELENHLETRENTHSFDAAHLLKIVERIVKAGNAMQHGKWTGCECDTCTDWQKAKEELYRRHSPLFGENDEVGVPKVVEKVFTLKVSEL